MSGEIPFNQKDIGSDEILDIDLPDDEINNSSIPREASTEETPSYLPDETTPPEVVSYFLKQLGLKKEDLIGKKVLDVGAENDRFAEACKATGLSTEIYSIDKSPEGGSSPDSAIRTGKYLKADAKAMPFGDGTFDTVVSVCALPIMARVEIEGRSVKDSMSEMIRVTKSGGQLVFTPVFGAPMFHDDQGKPVVYSDPMVEKDTHFAQTIDSILDELAVGGYVCTKELIESRQGKKVFKKENIFVDQDFFRIKIIKP